MTVTPRTWLCALLLGVCSHTAVAQPQPLPTPEPAPLQTHQVISANPFGLVFDLFNVEYERKASETTTAGVGGSFYSVDSGDYLNADVFYRFYPRGRPLSGISLGVKAGVTHVDSDDYFGVGFDVNWSWVLGKGDHFYMSTGFGLKRLFGTGDDDVLAILPTLRILNVGIAF